MDIKDFLRLLSRYKWLLIIIPIISVSFTYFLVKDLPKTYKSTAQISTGLIDQSKQISSANNNQDYFKVNSQFANIIEIMRMDKTISELSYNLILHDLQNPKDPFVKWSDEIKNLSKKDQESLVLEYKKLLAKREVVTQQLNGKLKLYDILKSMGYDKDAINDKLSVYHVDNSDFITISFTSNNANLSAFTVNTLASEFINAYGIDVANNQNVSNLLLDSLLKQKERVMNDKNAALKNFKVSNGVLNLDKQSEIIYKQITDYEQKKSDAIREIQSKQGAITSIDRRLTSNDKTYSGGPVISDNNNIINIRSQLKIANERYVDNNFKASDKKRVDSLQAILASQVAVISDRYIPDPTVNKQSLISQKMTLEIELDLVKNSVRSIDAELLSLRSKYNTMVPFDAGVQNYERDADVATKEYLEILNKTNENSLEKKIGLKLGLAQIGYPGLPESSKKILYILLSGVASFMICFMSVLLVFLLDRSINTTDQLKKVTNGAVIGTLNLINNENREVGKMWKDEDSNLEFAKYKNLLRSLRFEIDELLSASGDKILGITSLSKSEGKTFLASSLAYAFAMTGKKVLLISSEKEDEVVNADQKQISNQFFETFIVRKEIQTEDLITVLKSKSDTTSLLEIQSKDNLKLGFSILKNQFDIIIVDINSLEYINRAKEWLLFTEKNISVFKAGQSLKDSDIDKIKFISEHPGFSGWILNKYVGN